MKGFEPQTLLALRSHLVRWWAVWRLGRWCERIATMPEADFDAELLDSVVNLSMDGDRRESPLTWLCRAMLDAAGTTAPLRAAIYIEHAASYTQSFKTRLAASVSSLPRDQYASLALFMMHGARCEDVAEWEGTSQEEVADRIAHIARELSTELFGAGK